MRHQVAQLPLYTIFNRVSAKESALWATLSSQLDWQQAYFPSQQKRNLQSQCYHAGFHVQNNEKQFLKMQQQYVSHSGYSSQSISNPNKLKIDPSERARWEALQQQGHQINPCNSPLHPAALTGLIQSQQSEISVQEAYTPDAQCYGCGPRHTKGLKLRSFRIANGLVSRVTFPTDKCAFPDMVHGGILSVAFECHGNWTAALALMDRQYLPRPPLTLPKQILVEFNEFTPPDVQLLIQSQVAHIQDSGEVNGVGVGKPTVRVDMTLHHELEPGSNDPEALKLLATCQGIFTRVGALRPNL